MSSGRRLCIVLLFAAAAPACSPRPPRDLPSLERYPVPRGSVSPVRIGRITRPALRLSADDVVRWRTRGGPGSRLLFAVGATDRAESVTALAVDVEAGGRSAYQRRVPLSRDRWFPCTIDLPPSGPVEISIRVRPEKAPGAAVRGAEDVRIALSVPRLYRSGPGSSGGRPPRTLVWISQD